MPEWVAVAVHQVQVTARMQGQQTLSVQEMPGNQGTLNSPLAGSNSLTCKPPAESACRSLHMVWCTNQMQALRILSTGHDLCYPPGSPVLLRC